MLQRIDRMLRRVSHLPSAVRYYTQTMGLTLVHQSPRIATLRFPTDQSELVLHDDPSLPDEAIYFLVDNVRDLHARRQELGLVFTGPPTQTARGYWAVIKDPFGNTLLIIDRSHGNSATTEDTRSAGGSLFADVVSPVAPKRQILHDLYEKIGRTADDLPYTPQFESLFNAYIAQHPDPKPTRQETWRHLLNLRKAGKLPRLGPAKSVPPDISDADRQRLRDLLGTNIGRRDRMPYTDDFNALVDQFNKSLPRPLSPHLVWRLVATLAK